MSTRRDEENNATMWRTGQAYTLAAICLLLGLAVGFLLRGSAQVPVAQAVVQPTPLTDLGPAQMQGLAGIPGTQPASDLVDKMVAPLLDAVQRNPKDSGSLVKIGNTYFDAKLYEKAIQYYADALKITPNDVNVRTDMATAYWYLGDAEHAVSEFEKSLQHQPTHAQTLFNMGVVKWQSRKDIPGAIAAWEKLLRTNPNYPERQNVEQLLQQARNSHS